MIVKPLQEIVYAYKLPAQFGYVKSRNLETIKHIVAERKIYDDVQLE